MLYAVSVITTGFAGIAATILFRSEFGLASLAVRENNLRVEYLGISANRIITDQFRDCRDLCRCQRRVCADGAAAYRSAICLLDDVRRVRLRGGARRRTKASPRSSSPRWRWNWCVRSRTCTCPIPGSSCSASSCSASSCFCRAASVRCGSGTGTGSGEKRAQAIASRERGGVVTPVLSVRGLDKRFGAVVAADALTLDIPAGPESQPDRRQRRRQDNLRQHGHRLSEAGQGIDVRSTGWISAGVRPRNVARLGISRSFQIPQLFIELTAAENLTVAISGGGTTRICHSIRRRARSSATTRRVELLQRFGLADLADRPISELAGGVRKLIDIAMALVRRPKLLLLDEPTSGVSAEEKFATMDRVIHAVAPDAATIVFRRARHGNRQPLCRSRGGVLPGPHSRRRRTRPCAEGSRSAPLRHRGRAMSGATPLLEIEQSRCRDPVDAGAARLFDADRATARWWAWSAATAPARPR